MLTSFERGKSGFERVARGIRRPAVFVTFVLANALLHIGRGHVYRGHDGTCTWVRLYSGMNGEGAEPRRFFIVRHATKVATPTLL